MISEQEIKKDLPSGWSVSDLGSLGTFSKGKGILKEQLSAYGLPCVRYGELYTTHDLIVRHFGSYISKAVAAQSKQIKSGDILFAGSGETRNEIGKAAAYLKDTEAYAGGDVIILSTGSSQKAEFLSYAMESKLVRKQRFQLGEGHSVVHIYPDDLARIRAILPPLPEQKAIAQVLGAMDELISKTNCLIAQKNLRKKYLTQTLLTGKKRLKGFRKKWKTYPFRELATESVFRNAGKMSNDRLMAVYKAHGMIPMRERVQGASNHRCKVVRQNYFAYNPMRLNIGSLARWDGEEPAMVSGDYVVFKCEEERLDPRFFDFYRSTNEWANYVRRAGDGSVRVRIYFSHLAPLKIALPSIEEQKAIANILDIATCEITMLEAKSELLKMQKKWLMQQLLTGKKRLQTEEAS